MTSPTPPPPPSPAPDAPRTHARLTDEPLSVGAAHAFCADRAAGAVVVFAGTVRDHADDRAVRALTYESFEERARPQLEALAGTLVERHPAVSAVWIEHRLGTLAVGEPSVVVGVSGPHRDQAFAAARDGIDTLKATVAIWKQEHWADGGTRWVGSA